MNWDEFCTYLAGLDDTTPLGRIVSIRSEKNPETIKNFTPEEKRIRFEWNQKMVKTQNTPEVYEQMKAMTQALAAAFK